MPGIKIKQIKSGKAFVQFAPGDEVLYLGTTVKHIGLVETGTMRPSMRADGSPFPKRPLQATIQLTEKAIKSMERLDIAIGRYKLNVERRARAERRRLWPRYALAFTLFVAGVAIWM